MSKSILYGNEAREKLRSGIDKTANAVKVTMGARGRLVNLSNGHSTKDGVTVARDIDLEDQFENKGASLLKVASIKTNDVVGDGTTATCVLAQSMVNSGFGMISGEVDAQSLRKDLEDIKPIVIEKIKSFSKKITDVTDVAIISSNDEKMGKLVAEAVNKVGSEGLVSVENSYDPIDSVEIVEGMQIDKGTNHQIFYTEPSRRRAEYNNPAVIVYDGDLHDVQGFFTMLTPLFANGDAVVIFANSFDEQILHNMFMLRAQKGIKILPIITPHVYRHESIEDIAIYTGARVLREADSLGEQDVTKIKGHVKSIVSTPERTVLRSDGTGENEIAERIKLITLDAEAYNDAEKKEVMKRASRLDGKVAIIKTYSTTDEEMREKRDRIDDAIFASQAALRDGIVIGGGVTYARVAEGLEPHAKEYPQASTLLMGALRSPLLQIAENAGAVKIDVLIGATKDNQIYDARNGEFESMDITKIVDPTASLITAFENALSVAIIALTTEVLIIEDIKE